MSGQQPKTSPPTRKSSATGTPANPAKAPSQSFKLETKHFKALGLDQKADPATIKQTFLDYVKSKAEAKEHAPASAQSAASPVKPKAQQKDLELSHFLSFAIYVLERPDSGATDNETKLLEHAKSVCAHSKSTFSFRSTAEEQLAHFNRLLDEMKGSADQIVTPPSAVFAAILKIFTNSLAFSADPCLGRDFKAPMSTVHTGLATLQAPHPKLAASPSPAESSSAAPSSTTVTTTTSTTNTSEAGASSSTAATSSTSAFTTSSPPTPTQTNAASSTSSSADSSSSKSNAASSSSSLAPAPTPSLPPIPETPQLTETEQQTLAPLKAASQKLKALRDALKRRLSDFEHVVFADPLNAALYAPLLQPVNIPGQPETKESKESDAKAIVSQAETLRADIIALKQEISMRTQEAASPDENKATPTYQKELTQLSQQLEALDGYSVRLMPRKPRDEEITQEKTLYLYQEGKVLYYAFKAQTPEFGLLSMSLKCPIKRLEITLTRQANTHLKSIATKLGEAKKQPQPLLTADELQALFNHTPKTEDNYALFREIDAVCADILTMAREVNAIAAFQSNPNKQQEAMFDLAFRSHSNHPQLTTISTKSLSTRKQKEITAIQSETKTLAQKTSLQTKQAGVTHFVDASKARHTALWTSSIAEVKAPTTSSSQQEQKTALAPKFPLDILTLHVSAIINQTVGQIMGLWSENQNREAVKQRLLTRTARLNALITPLTATNLRVIQSIQARYIADIVREVIQRFRPSVEMERAISQLYDLFVIACEIAKEKVEISGVGLNGAFWVAKSLIKDGIKEGLFNGFKEHNSTLVMQAEKLNALLELGRASTADDANELRYAAFIMETYVERMFSYLTLYEETFPECRNGQDKIYNNILASFEQLIINSTNLYSKYAQVRRTTPTLCSESETPEKHCASLEQYQRFYAGVIKPRRYGNKSGDRTSVDEVLQQALHQFNPNAHVAADPLPLQPQSPTHATASSSSTTQPNSTTTLALTQGADSSSSSSEASSTPNNRTPVPTAEPRPSTPTSTYRPATQNNQRSSSNHHSYTANTPQHPWWQRILAFFGFYLVLSLIALVTVSVIAPELLTLPLLATLLSYTTFGSYGGLLIGVAALSAALTLVSVLAWLLYSACSTPSQPKSLAGVDEILKSNHGGSPANTASMCSASTPAPVKMSSETGPAVSSSSWLCCGMGRSSEV